MKYSSTVDVEKLEADTCSKLLESLDQTIAFDKKIYCKGITNVAVESEAATEPVEDDKGTESPPTKPTTPTVENTPNQQNVTITSTCKADNTRPHNN